MKQTAKFLIKSLTESSVNGHNQSEIVYSDHNMIHISLEQASGLTKLSKNGQQNQDHEFFIKTITDL